MATFADLFTTYYLTGGSDVEFSKVRVHFRGADAVCRAFGAMALTIGSDIYFRDGAFAPHTPAGLRILAHEVAHVVQQHSGPVAARPVVSPRPVADGLAGSFVGGLAGGLVVAPAGSAEEHEAEAAAEALLSGRPFAFAPAPSPARAPGTRRRCPCIERHVLAHDDQRAAVPARTRSLRPGGRRGRRTGRRIVTAALGPAERGRGPDPSGPYRSQWRHRQLRTGAA